MTRIVIGSAIPQDIYIEYGFLDADLTCLCVTLHEKRPKNPSGLVKRLKFETRIMFGVDDRVKSIAWQIDAETLTDAEAEPVLDSDFQDASCYLLTAKSSARN